MNTATGADRRIASLPGREVAYRDVVPVPGVDPAPRQGVAPVLMVHGIGSSMDTWGPVPERLAAAGLRVLVVDLPGHGESSRGRGDYSLGALASTLRDLLDHLSIASVHFIGHSLGGGVAMQFAYQFPDRVASLLLESSGGLGEEVFPGLRAASLPGAHAVIGWAINERTLSGAAWVGGRLARVGVTPHALSPHALQTVGRLSDPQRRAAFVATVRGVISPRGQSVSALEIVPLWSRQPVLFVWGDRDPMIPVSHGHRAHALVPGSTLVVFPGAGHEPHQHDPDRFAALAAHHVLSVAS